jgi:hypothetical protein
MARHSPDVLERMAVEHVTYELRMLGYTAGKGTPAGDVGLGFAVLESYLLHCRNIAEFLRKGQNLRPNDLVAHDYFDASWAGVTLPPRFPITDLNRRLAHLTTDRLTSNALGSGFDWSAGAPRPGDRAQWARMLQKPFGQFLGDLRAVHPDRAAWFDQGFKDLKTTLRALT